MNKEELKKFLEEATPYFNLVYGKNRWWLTGSAFLLFNGYIDRDINDIDINTIISPTYIIILLFFIQ